MTHEHSPKLKKYRKYPKISEKSENPGYNPKMKIENRLSPSTETIPRFKIPRKPVPQEAIDEYEAAKPIRAISLRTAPYSLQADKYPELELDTPRIPAKTMGPLAKTMRRISRFLSEG